MNKKLRNRLVSAGVLLGAISPAVVLVFGEAPLHHVFSFANIPADQKLLALISYLAAAIIIWYTWETRQLRKIEDGTLHAIESQTRAIRSQTQQAAHQTQLIRQQFQAQNQPYLTLRWEDDPGTDGSAYIIENIGPGIALNVSISDLYLTDSTTLGFPTYPTIGPVGTVSGFVSITVNDLWPHINSEEEARSKGGAPALRGLISDNLKQGAQIIIEFDDLSHRHFKAVFEYDRGSSGNYKILSQGEDAT